MEYKIKKGFKYRGVNVEGFLQNHWVSRELEKLLRSGYIFTSHADNRLQYSTDYGMREFGIVGAFNWEPYFELVEDINICYTDE